jgi:hypothetical protein
VVTSRSGSLPASALAELAAAGCTVLAVKADSADAATMQRVLDWAREELPHIQHFAHAAGVSGFAMLQDMSSAEFSAVADVKVRHSATGFGGHRCPIILLVLLSRVAHFNLSTCLPNHSPPARRSTACRLQRLLPSSTLPCPSPPSSSSPPLLPFGARPALPTMPPPTRTWMPTPLPAIMLACLAQRCSTGRLRGLAWRQPMWASWQHWA